LAAAAEALSVPATARLREDGTRLELLAEKVRLLDPQRLLERGFTLTRDARGRLVTRAAETRSGQPLRTRFADGEITSIVTENGGGPRRETRKGGRGGGEEDSGQQALF
jgi:exonuclease VII large subunit